MATERVRTLIEAIQALLEEDGVKMLRVSELPSTIPGGDTRRVVLGLTGSTLEQVVAEIRRVNRGDNQSLAVVIPIHLFRENSDDS